MSEKLLLIDVNYNDIQHIIKYINTNYLVVDFNEEINGDYVGVILKNTNTDISNIKANFIEIINTVSNSLLKYTNIDFNYIDSPKTIQYGITTNSNLPNINGLFWCLMIKF